MYLLHFHGFWPYDLFLFGINSDGRISRTYNKAPRVEDRPLTRLLTTQDYTPQKKIVNRLFSACDYNICNYFYTALSYCCAGMSGFCTQQIPLYPAGCNFVSCHEQRCCRQRCVPLPQLSFCDKPNCSKLCQV